MIVYDRYTTTKLPNDFVSFFVTNVEQRLFGVFVTSKVIKQSITKK